MSDDEELWSVDAALCFRDFHHDEAKRARSQQIQEQCYHPQEFERPLLPQEFEAFMSARDFSR